jgi:hypothetical protein
MNKVFVSVSALIVIGVQLLVVTCLYDARSKPLRLSDGGINRNHWKGLCHHCRRPECFTLDHQDEGRRGQSEGTGLASRHGVLW